MTSDCVDVLGRLEAWIDGELEASDAAGMKVHISGCSSCREEYQMAEAIRAELRGMPEIEPPQRVLSAVREKARPAAQEKPGGVLGRVTRRPVPAAIAIAAAAILLVVVVPRGDRSEAQYTDLEIRRAAAETRIALAYVGDAARRAEREVRKKVLENRDFPATVRGVSRTLSWAGETGAAQPEVSPSPTNTSKGS
jgi:anti-sigma factor (TIGR02949 family)